jgi:hypothetical protein
MPRQAVQDTESRPGKLIGTVTDVNGDPVANATVTLETPESDNRRTLATPESVIGLQRPSSTGLPNADGERAGSADRIFIKSFGMMVARDGVEPPTPAFSDWR